MDWDESRRLALRRLWSTVLRRTSRASCAWLCGVSGSAHRRRVVLLTDGRQTEGDLLSAARQFAEAGIGLDVVQVAQPGVTDVVVSEVRAPARAREGEAYNVVRVVSNTSGEPALLRPEGEASGWRLAGTGASR